MPISLPANDNSPQDLGQLFGDFTDATEDGTSFFITKILDWLTERLDEIWRAITQLDDNIIGALKSPLDYIDAVVTSLWERVPYNLEQLLSRITANLSSLTDKIVAPIRTALDALGIDLEQYAQRIQDYLRGLASGINKRLGDIIALIPELPAAIGDAMIEGVAGAFVKFLGIIGRDFLEASPALREKLREASTLSPEFAQLFNYMEANRGQLAGILGMSLGTATLSTGLGQILDQTFRPLGYMTASQLRNTILSPGEAIAAFYRFPMFRDRVRQTLSAWGYPDAEQELLINLGVQLLSVGELGALWLRGEITESALDNRLRQLGWADYDLPYLKTLLFPIPGVSDLVRMAVREAFSPEIAARFGQYEDLPPKFLEHARKIGLTEEWASAFWASHWDLPSVQMGFEMLHRGIISEDELKLLLRALDVMPYWRDRLVQLSYSPFTRVDVRRMYRLGILDRSQVKRSYLDLGYDEFRAEALTEFTVQDAEKAKRRTQDKERDLTRNDIVTLYRSQLIQVDVAQKMLSELGYSAQEVNYIIAMADFREALEDRNELLRYLKVEYHEWSITLAEARQALQKAGLDEREINYHLAKWKRTRPRKPADTLGHKERDLTRGIIVTLYRTGLLVREKAESFLSNLGYDSQEVSYILALADYMETEEQRQEELEHLRLQYQKGLIDDSTLIDSLGKLNLPEKQIRYYLHKWDRTKPVSVRFPTLEHLEKFVKRKLISLQDYTQELMNMGYPAKWAQIYTKSLQMDLTRGR